MTTYWLERAWTGSGPVRSGLLVDVEDGVFTRVATGPPGDADRLAGLSIPGLANCHSHAFHRALRGRTQRGRGSFWTWREQMYAVAARLTPDSYFELARAAYREMVAVGFTSVGEFHYLHHGPGGTPYDDPNAMSHALVAAAAEAGIRIALLDTCYLAAGIGSPPEGVQARFSDGDAEGWALRTAGLDKLDRPGSDVVPGAAIHSVRAVPRDQMRHVVGWAEAREAPLHVHLSEQPAENDACLAAYGATPTEVLADVGALGARTSAVHATHLTDRDVALLGGSATNACFCPTTERDLGDGVGPSRALRVAGSPLTLGSDSHAVVDPFEEMRAVELDERLATRQRGHWPAAELLTAAANHGHRSLGFEGVGRIEVGARADLVTLDTSSVRTAGTGADEATAVFAASGADVVRVMRDGVVVSTPDDRRAVGAELDRVVRAIWEEVSSLILGGIGELVTNDPAREGLLGVVRDAALVVESGRVAWTGPEREAPAADVRYEVGGRAVVPGFVDSHSHLMFAGDRAEEFAARMTGTPYSAGGIATTVAATRAATDEQLAARLARLLDEMHRQGTTTVEVKSGYGLTVADEARALAIAAQATPETTFLGAHVVPPEYAGDPGAYVDLVTGPMLEACAPHARWVDVFCERGAFDEDQARAILGAGRAAGLHGRLHANQLGPGPGVRLACELGLVAVDHCTHLSDADVDALAASGTTATLLPGVEFSTRSPYPDARRLLDAGVRVALASDCNPGSCYSSSVPLCIALAVREMGMSPAEAVFAATAGGARALARADVGHLGVGAAADLVVLDAPSYLHLAYRPGVPLVHETFLGGRPYLR